MTEYTPEQVAELIAEARSRTYTPSRPAMLVTRLADALEAVSAERDEARRWAETMQAQKFEWEGKEATVRAEHEEALAAIAELARIAKHCIPVAEVDRILSRIPEHPKED